MLFLALLSGGEHVVIGKGALTAIILGALFVIIFIYALEREDRGLKFFPRLRLKSPRPHISEDEVFNVFVQRKRRGTVSAEYVARVLDTGNTREVLRIILSLVEAGKIRRVSDTCSGKEEFGLK
jgi:hypothetical protein